MRRRRSRSSAASCPGHYYFRDNWYADSGMIAMLAVLRLLSKDDKPLSEVVKPIENRFRSGEINPQGGGQTGRDRSGEIAFHRDGRGRDQSTG